MAGVIVTDGAATAIAAGTDSVAVQDTALADLLDAQATVVWLAVTPAVPVVMPVEWPEAAHR
jgi:hypothetical protein